MTSSFSGKEIHGGGIPTRCSVQVNVWPRTWGWCVRDPAPVVVVVGSSGQRRRKLWVEPMVGEYSGGSHDT
jgi:hypothetical protein